MRWVVLAMGAGGSASEIGWHTSRAGARGGSGEAPPVTGGPYVLEQAQVLLPANPHSDEFMERQTVLCFLKWCSHL